MSGIRTDAKLQEIIDIVSVLGEKGAASALRIKESTVRRAVRQANEHELRPSKIRLPKVLEEINERFSESELKAISKGARISPGLPSVPVAKFDGDCVTIGIFSDTHIGSIYTDNSHIFKAFHEFDKEKVDFIVHCGDVVEGFSHREGHVYEVTHIGYEAQKETAIRIFEHLPAPMYMIDGNHDRWYLKRSGAYVVKDIADKLKSVTYLGSDEGDISLGSSATLKLWHGEDGNSYAISYRMQKIVESLTGGTKPNILIAGHVHKMIYLFLRHIHCIGAGAIQMQSKWMRGKRIESHTGFWIIKAWVNETGIGKFSSTWYPLYV